MPRLITFAIHMITIDGVGRPCPSSQDEPATDSVVAGRDRAKIRMTGSAPVVRTGARPITCRNGGPKIHTRNMDPSPSQKA